MTGKNTRRSSPDGASLLGTSTTGIGAATENRLCFATQHPTERKIWMLTQCPVRLTMGKEKEKGTRMDVVWPNVALFFFLFCRIFFLLTECHEEKV